MRPDRLFLSVGCPVAFGENWLTPDAATPSPVDIQGMSTAAVHRLILRHPIASSTNAISAGIAGATVGRCLGLGARSAVLVLTRTRFDIQGHVREHNRFTADSSAYAFTFSTMGNGGRGRVAVRRGLVEGAMPVRVLTMVPWVGFQARVRPWIEKTLSQRRPIG